MRKRRRGERWGGGGGGEGKGFISDPGEEREISNLKVSPPNRQV